MHRVNKELPQTAFLSCYLREVEYPPRSTFSWITVTEIVNISMCWDSVPCLSVTPSPVVTKVENIYDVKSWQRPYVATFKYHSHPHAFCFKLNDQGEVEMSYRNWVNSKRREWLPKEGPFLIMWELPPGEHSLLRPDLKKCPSVLDIREAIAKLKVRMSVSEVDWWEKMANDEENRVDLWNLLSD